LIARGGRKKSAGHGSLDAGQMLASPSENLSSRREHGHREKSLFGELGRLLSGRKKERQQHHGKGRGKRDMSCLLVFTQGRLITGSQNEEVLFQRREVRTGRSNFGRGRRSKCEFGCGKGLEIVVARKAQVKRHKSELGKTTVRGVVGPGNLGGHAANA